MRADAQTDATIAREGSGVGQQMEQRLLQARAIEQDPARAGRIGQENKRVALLRRKARGMLRDRAEQRAQVDIGRTQRELVALAARVLEQLVDQCQLVGRLALDGVQMAHAAGLGRWAVVSHEAGIADDARQRRTQVVADERHDARLLSVVAFRFGQRGVQRPGLARDRTAQPVMLTAQHIDHLVLNLLALLRRLMGPYREGDERRDRRGEPGRVVAQAGQHGRQRALQPHRAQADAQQREENCAQQQLVMALFASHVQIPGDHQAAGDQQRHAEVDLREDVVVTDQHADAHSALQACQRDEIATAACGLNAQTPGQAVQIEHQHQYARAAQDAGRARSPHGALRPKIETRQAAERSLVQPEDGEARTLPGHRRIAGQQPEHQ